MNLRVSLSGRYLAYTDKECCIEVSMVGTKRASDATSKREFICRDAPLKKMIPEHLHSPHPYITNDYILEIFHPKVVSANVIDNTFREIQSHLYTAVCSSLGHSLAGKIGKHISDSLQGVMKNVQDEHH